MREPELDRRILPSRSFPPAVLLVAALVLGVVSEALHAAPDATPRPRSIAAPVQPQQSPQRGQQPVFDANIELAMVNVAVLGGGGVPIVADLTPEDFVVEEDGEERDVGFVRSPFDAPLDIALVLDLSLSMQMTPWRDRAAEFLQALDPDKDCVLMMGFSDSIGRSIWARPDDPFLEASVERTMAGGGTALYDATLYAIGEMAYVARSQVAALFDAFAASSGTERVVEEPVVRRPGGCPVPYDPVRAADPSTRRRQAIVIVSDAGDSTSNSSVQLIGMATKATGLPLFHLRLSGEGTGQPQFPPDRLNEDDPRRLRRQQIRAESSGEFERFLMESGGRSLPPSPTAFEELLERLRGFYVVGYYVPRAAADTMAELIRHEVRVELPGVNADIIHPRQTYRSTIDRVGATTELDQSRRELAADDAYAALFAIDNAVAADPHLAAAWQQRAIVLEGLGRNTEAMLDAQKAAGLAPGDAEIHRLAMRLSLANGTPDIAWEHAIRAVQAGADLTDELRALAAELPPPDDLENRLAAPTVAIVTAPSRDSNLLARAALPRALLAVRRTVADAPLLALVDDPRRAEYVIAVADRDIDQEPPRRFTGQITMRGRTGDELYDEGLSLDNLDDALRNAADLQEHLREIEERAAEHGSPRIDRS